MDVIVIFTCCDGEILSEIDDQLIMTAFKDEYQRDCRHRLISLGEIYVYDYLRRPIVVVPLRNQRTDKTCADVGTRLEAKLAEFNV